MRTKTIKATIGITPGYDLSKEPNNVNIHNLIGDICKNVWEDTGINVSFVVTECSACYCVPGGFNNEIIYMLETTMDPRLYTIKEWEPTVLRILSLLKNELDQIDVIITGTYSEVNYLSDYHDRDNNLCPDGKIYWAKVRKDAIIPTRRLEDAGYDLYPNFEEPYIIIKPQETKLIGTGIAVSVPVGYVLQIEERGSSGSKGIKYSAGVIDSGYRGEINLCVTNSTNKLVIICKKNYVDLVKNLIGSISSHSTDRDYIIYPYEKALFQGCVHTTCNELDSEEIDYETLCHIESDRGTGKLGSSNK